jgi:hypothetical protein
VEPILPLLDEALRRVFARAFLYNDPDSFRAGAEEIIRVLTESELRISSAVIA